MTTREVRAPIHIDHVLDDPAAVRELVREHAPYWPVYRYFGDNAELRATGAPLGAAQDRMRVPPWFRRDWAHEQALVAGIEPLLENRAFDRAARDLYGLSDEAVVRQQLVYVNVTLPMPLVDPGHTDVPAFRGIDRRSFPIWLLAVMGHSGLFERWRVRIATAVSWWSDVEGGEFTFWRDGPDAPPVVLRPRSNSAIVGENEVMFHRVERVGRPEDESDFDGMSVDAALVVDGGAWLVVDAGRSIARIPFDAARISVSWKAVVFADEAEAERVDQHSDDLDADRVCAMLLADLRRRGVDLDLGLDPLCDSVFMAAVTDAYPRSPTVFPEH